MKTFLRLCWFQAPLALVLGCSDPGTVIMPPVAWDLVWSDEFDGAADTVPLAANWSFDLGNGEAGWGNNELQSYTDSTRNAAQDGNGNLVITARKEPADGLEYTSARITSQGKREQQYGRFEARIRLPSGRGLWPAFWMMGNNFRVDGVSWPDCGEIDIMEYRGQEPSEIHGSVHGPKYSSSAALTKRYAMENGNGFDQDFHVFTVEWDPGRIAWFVDDKPYFYLSTQDVTQRGRWVFNRPFFILFNIAVGGTFVGAPNASTVFPQEMTIDYVRLYERRSAS